MPLVSMKQLLDLAEREDRAVGAFSVGNMEMVYGAVEAAESMDTPIILQIAEKRLSCSPFALMAPMMISAAKHSKVDIAVHLDHGITLPMVREALNYGFTSVMLDASLRPFEENVAMTKQVVALAKEFGATVEAELGVVGGNEGNGDHRSLCTEPDDAERFAAETGIDALAVAIGNAHGHYPTLPALRFDVLEEINSRLSIPLVLHGGTGITPEMFRKAIHRGVRKINIATANFDALAAAAKEYCSGVSEADYFILTKQMRGGIYENVRYYISIFNNR